jgi:glycine/D-amino acid oxidase-like deaminating enzyme
VKSFYDVVVLGMRLSTLAAAALLAKRGFRVLVLGEGEPAPSYELEGVTLPRGPYTFLAAHSPVARRIFSELALNPTFRRRAASLDPVLQIAIPKHRFDLSSDDERFAREIEREFPAVRRPIEDFHRETLRASEELDRILERDLSWPPTTFFERRELARLAAHQRFDRDGGAHDLLAELPEHHPFRLAVRAPLAFASYADPDPTTALRATRLYAAWLRGAAAVEGGWAGLRAMLADKIRTHGGDVRERDRAERILLAQRRASGVALASGEEAGASFVIAGGDVSATLRLVPDRRPFEEVFERWGEPQPRFFRYSLSAVIDEAGVPAGMDREVVIVRDAKKPLWGDNLVRVERCPRDQEGRVVLSAEALLPRRGVEEVPGYLEAARSRVLGAIEELVPFLREHLLYVDSPHDGLDAEAPRERRFIPSTEPWTRGPEHMRAVYGYPVTTALGTSAMPVRTPIRRLLLCNDQVVPSLGEEGELLAAWSAARIVARSDKKKEWMRRGLWTKVEI